MRRHWHALFAALLPLYLLSCTTVSVTSPAPAATTPPPPQTAAGAPAAPAASAAAAESVAPDAPPDPPPVFVARRHADAIRLLNWNVRLSSVVGPDGARHAAFARIIRATRPDIVVLQEIMLPAQREQLRDTMQWLQPDATWHLHAVSDNLLLSRFTLLRRDGEEVIANPVPRLGLDDFHLGHAAVLVDVPDQLGNQDLYVVAVHNKSRGGADNIEKRQRHSDAIIRLLRDSPIDSGTPVVIAGDLNVLVSEVDDPLQHLTTLLTGDIVNEQRDGPDYPPDRDGSALTDLRPRHNAIGDHDYTWRIDETPYPPGALDRILYTDSVLRARHSFVLDTTAMSDADLERAGLERSDVLFDGRPGYYDHLPMVVDFSFMPRSRQQGRPSPAAD